MPTRPAQRALAQNWIWIPGACSPIGGGLVKLGHGSNVVAFAVSAAPYAIYALPWCLFGIGYLFAAFRYLCTGRSQQEFIEISANAVVSIISLTPTASPGHAGRSTPIPPRPRAGGSDEYVSSKPDPPMLGG